MAINSISNGSGHKPINISENHQTHSTTKNQSVHQQGTATNSLTGDTVSLTGTASQLRALEQQIANLPVVDVQRVESIKQDIASGSYQIDPPRVADKMIQIESAINQRLI